MNWDRWPKDDYAAAAGAGPDPEEALDRASARNNAIHWARMMMGRPDTWVVMDTETTGLRGAEIVQLGLLRPNGTVALDSFVRPMKPVEASATAIHGITDAGVEDAPPLVNLLPVMEREMHGKTVVIYNKGFDQGVLHGALRRRQWAINADLFADTWIAACSWQCAMLAYAEFAGDWNDYRQSYAWQKLPGGGHSAIADCRATLTLIERMATAKTSEEIAKESEE